VAAAGSPANLKEPRVKALAFSPDGKTLASAHQDGTAGPGLAKGKEWVLQQSGSAVLSLAYSPDASSWPGRAGGNDHGVDVDAERRR